jgi:hypothetical protein
VGCGAIHHVIILCMWVCALHRGKHVHSSCGENVKQDLWVRGGVRPGSTAGVSAGGESGDANS